MPFTGSIVTTCTQRKSQATHVDIVQLGDAGTLKILAAQWNHIIKNAPPTCTPASLYQGRSVSDTTMVAAHLSSPWYVISAGLGLVREDCPVPSYECTVSARSELSQRLDLLGATPADWWTALTASNPQPLSELVDQGQTLLALPSSYLRMVLPDLSQVSTAKAKHLRIFTSTAGAKVVPARLASCVMPYDDRLESVPGYAGTRADFAQRALRHFVLKLDAAVLPREEARAKVAAALSRRARPSRPSGARLTDDEIRRTLMTQWSRHEGRSTRLLRYLRDEARISCEQKRFSRIWQSLSAEMQA